MMHIYIFGSLCRGEISTDSDVDLLALTEGFDQRLNKEDFSIYSYERMTELWREGNAFAWHLFLESRLVYASDDKDFLSTLGQPSPYKNGYRDCLKFRELFELSAKAVLTDTTNLVFELSTIFLALRNIGTCYSLVALDKPCFGRHSALQLGTKSLNIDPSLYKLFEHARILSTRGVGTAIINPDAEQLRLALKTCRNWVELLCEEVNNNE